MNQYNIEVMKTGTRERPFCARPSAANSEILSSFMLSIDVVAQVITWRFELLSATSMVAAPHWGDCSLSVEKAADEISATGGRLN